MLQFEYARRGEISIAYQVIGNGPVDIVFGAGLVSHLDLLWCDPEASEFFRQLGEFGRLILFDKPGTGLSDPVVGIPTVEQRAQDFLAVLDAAGSHRAVVIGLSEAAAPAALLSATHPDRVEALVLVSGFARATTTEYYLPECADWFENVWWKVAWHSADHWGDGAMMLALSPWIRGSALYRRLAPNMERACTSPGMAHAILHGMRSYDVLPALDSVRVPTLVIHRKDEFIPIECGRDFGERIAGARLAELPGNEHLCFFGGDDILESIGRFLGGSRPSRAGSARALTTVLFTDIVASTATAAAIGNERWRALLAQHDRVTDDEVERHGGRVVKNLGDGVLATFERPLMSIRCARALSTRLADIGVIVRAGIHTGECDLVGEDVAGIAVHLGARIAALATAGEILVSSTVRDLVLGSGVQFADRGIHDLKGIPGRWLVSAVIDDHSADQGVVKVVGPGGSGPAAASTMRPVDRALVALAARVPWLTRPALRHGGRIRSRYDPALDTLPHVPTEARKP